MGKLKCGTVFHRPAPRAFAQEPCQARDPAARTPMIKERWAQTLLNRNPLLDM